MIQILVEGLRNEFHLTHIRMDFSGSISEAGKFAWLKIFRLFKLIRQTISALRQHPGAILYYPPASPQLMPVLRDILFHSLVRPFAGKVVFHFHASGLGDYLRARPLLARLARKGLFQPDVAILQGTTSRRDDQVLGARQVWVVPNGRDVPLRSSAGRAEHHRPVVLYVGIHVREKGIFDLLEIARRCREAGVDAEFRTVGEWYWEHEQREWENRMASLGLGDRVTWAGLRRGDELWNEYAGADLFIFPTFYEWETMGLVLVEAMAYSLPIVASCWTGPADVVEDGRTGCLCPPRDTAAFAAAVARLCGDSALRKRMGAAGRERYEHLFTADRFLRDMKKVFAEMGAG